MWKTQLNKAVKELRFVIKQTPEHHGVWRFACTRLPELRMLNQNTFFAVSEIDHQYKTPSACHFIYGDVQNTEEMVRTDGLSDKQFEQILKEKIAFGLTLNRHPTENNDDRSIPIDIVESHKYVQHMDDGF